MERERERELERETERGEAGPVVADVTPTSPCWSSPARPTAVALAQRGLRFRAPPLPATFSPVRLPQQLPMANLPTAIGTKGSVRRERERERSVCVCVCERERERKRRTVLRYRKIGLIFSVEMIW